MTTVKGTTVSGSDFSQYQATKKLKEFAEQPFDLAKEGNLTPKRLEHFSAHACDIQFLYGTERVTSEIMHALMALAEEAKALEKMQRMQSGEKMNLIEGFPSENRPALHTAVRDFFESPHSDDPAADASKKAKTEIEKLKKFLDAIEKEKMFTDLIMIGIGGSDLGPRAHYIALKHLQKPGRNVHFISNVDPDDVAIALSQVDLKKTLVVVVSKSGSTLETRINEEFLRDRFKKAGVDPKGHFIAVTGEGSPMDNPGHYREVFYIWDWIGGRFSTTSMVGGVMLSFAFGFDVFWELLRGANGMDKIALDGRFSKNLPLLGALLAIWNHNFLGYPTLAIIPYSQALLRFPAHIQQVEMESNGKRIDQHGEPVDFQTSSIIWGEPGTNAQHSFFQLFHQGTATVPIEFIGFMESLYQEDLEIDGTTSQEKLLSNLFAQSIALAIGQTNDNPNKVFTGNRPSHILLARKLTPYILGALLSYFENKAVFQGFIWGINSFDQEGVQLGKVLSNKIIDLFAARRGRVKKTVEPFPLAEAFLRQLDLL